MKTCVVYDSVYGNTEKVAKAIGDAIPGEVEVIRAGQADLTALNTSDLVIVGSPTHAGRPTKSVSALLAGLPIDGLKGKAVAAFDTRVESRLARIFGYAAPRIAAKLAGKGGVSKGSPEGFIVDGKEGPLREGELERAAVWAKGIVGSMA